MLSASAAALAQPPIVAPASTDEERRVNFTADELVYDNDTEVVTVSGKVEMLSEGNNLRAERVIWNRRSGEVRAEGNVQVTNPQGDTVYGDSIVLTDTLRDGVISNLLLVLEDGGRLAAQRAERRGGLTTLDRAAYSPCAVVDENGCPKDPTWKITAVQVVHDPVRNRHPLSRASLNLFGTADHRLCPACPPGRLGGGGSGLLVPDVRFSRSNGLSSAPLLFQAGANRDATITRTSIRTCCRCWKAAIAADRNSARSRSADS
jgi:LPS-assembly protein